MDTYVIKYLLSGLASGSIYACLALSVVMIYKAVGHLNFAQGEMATLSTYVAWQFINWGLPVSVAIAFAIVASFLMGYSLERTIFTRIPSSSPLAYIVMFIGLFLAINGLTGFIWDFAIKPFPSVFGEQIMLFGGLIGSHQLGILAVTLIMLGTLSAFFKWTRVGLAMRAIAANPASAKLVGIRVAHLTAVGWGLSAAIGGLAGVLIAPLVFLDPNMMIGIIIPSFAGAVLGGLSSPIAAVGGGLLMGLIEGLVAAFVPVIGNELKLPIALAIIVIVLVVRPSGLLGSRIVERV